MPVVGTIAPQVTLPGCEPLPANLERAAVPCSGQLSLVPATTELHGKPLFTRMGSVSVSTGRDVRFLWTLRDPNGNPIDLTECVASSSSSASDSVQKLVTLRVTEQLTFSGACRDRARKFTGNIVDGANGVVEFALDGLDPLPAGIYFAEAGVYAEVTADGEPTREYLLFGNVFYLIVNRSHFGSGMRGPLTLPEIRLHLRDSHPGENFLIDGLQFDDAEIAMAIARPVEYWNEIPPSIKRYTTQSFPFRYHWLEATAGLLLQMSADALLNNRLLYSAGGVTVDTGGRSQEYRMVSAQRWDGFRKFVDKKKMEMNLLNGYGGVDSIFGRAGDLDMPY